MAADPPNPLDDPDLPALIAHEPESLRWHQERWGELLDASHARLRASE